jgi:hypothetical protein
MNDFYIFVEGDADRKFLHDYIEATFGVTLDAEKNSAGKIIKSKNIIGTEGCPALICVDTFREKMKENTQQGIINLVIFDADTPKNGGGVTPRKKAIEEWKAKYGLDFELFLFPNNKDDGALEDLLEQIINFQNKPVFDCWQQFEACLPTKTDCTRNPLTIPAKKSKIYAYLEVLHGETNREKESIKDPNRNFKNPQHWDLNASALHPLKDFLQQHLFSHP